MQISRRTFLAGSISAIASSVVGFGCGGLSEKRSPRPDRSSLPETETDLRAVVRKYFETSKMASVKVVGREYLKRFGTDDAAADDLSKTVRRIEDVADRTTAVEKLDARAVSDFEETRLVTVAGWQIARLEARMTALAASILDEEDE